MTRPGGDKAATLESFALGRELRGRRTRAGLTPSELAHLASIPRNKLDALELGDLPSRKKVGRLRREELLRLVCVPQLELSVNDIEGLVALAYLAGALGPWEMHSPITRQEWLAAGRKRSGASADVPRLVAPLLDRHRGAFRPAASSPIADERGSEWDLPTRRCRVFYGRDRELADIAERLCDPDRPRIVLLAGLPGSGKSELARAVVDHPRTRGSFRRCIWVSARPREFLAGSSALPSTVSSSEVLQRIARSLRCAVDEIPRAMSAEPILIVIDNTEVITDEEELLSRLAASAGVGKLLLTTRRWYAASFIDPFPPDGRLPGLSQAASEELLVDEARIRGGWAAGQLTRDAVRAARLWELSGGTPLVLHWIVGRSLRTELSAIAAELSAGRTGDLDRFMFEKAWQELSPRPREVLSFLVEAASEPVPMALMSMAGVAGNELQSALDELRASGFVEHPDGESSYGVHPLISSFARDQLVRTKKHRWTAAAASRPALEYLELSLADDRRGAHASLPLGGLGNYVGWMGAAVAAGATTEAIGAWTKLSRYLWEHWHWDLYEGCNDVGRRSIERLAKTRPLAGAMLRGLVVADAAYLRFEQARLDEALEAATAARSAFAELDDDAGLSIAARYEALIRLRRRDPVDQARGAIAAALGAVARARERGCPRPGSRADRAVAELTQLGLWEVIRGGYRSYRGEWGPAEAELHVIEGEILMQAGRFKEAALTLEQSVGLYVAASERWPGSEAGPMIALGDCLARLGDPKRSGRILRDALRIARRADRKDLEAGALIQLAKLRGAKGRTAQALARQALEIHTRLGQAEGIREARTLLSSS